MIGYTDMVFNINDKKDRYIPLIYKYLLHVNFEGEQQPDRKMVNVAICSSQKKIPRQQGEGVGWGTKKKKLWKDAEPHGSQENENQEIRPQFPFKRWTKITNGNF